jgi:hypothetical protein
MVDELIQVFESLKVPYCKQGSASMWSVYPETFITFWNNESPDHMEYDDHRYGTEWHFTIYVYSSDPEVTYSLLDQVREALESEGWFVPSKGFDANSDESTHTGRGIEIFKLEI